VGEGNQAKFGIGVDEPGILGKGVLRHGQSPIAANKPAPHFQMGRTGTSRGWKTGAIGPGVRKRTPAKARP